MTVVDRSPYPSTVVPTGCRQIYPWSTCGLPGSALPSWNAGGLVLRSSTLLVFLLPPSAHSIWCWGGIAGEAKLCSYSSALVYCDLPQGKCVYLSGTMQDWRRGTHCQKHSRASAVFPRLLIAQGSTRMCVPFSKNEATWQFSIWVLMAMHNKSLYRKGWNVDGNTTCG